VAIEFVPGAFVVQIDHDCRCARDLEELEDLAAALGGGRRACVAREITKRFETFYRGTLSELAARAKSDADIARGESVVVVEGAPETEPDAARLDEVLGILLRHLPPSAAAAAAAALTGLRRGDAYDRALALSRGADATS
jgi:16S rRNA (cytidine1402-2'-O)-methyltransferase